MSKLPMKVGELNKRQFLIQRAENLQGRKKWENDSDNLHTWFDAVAIAEVTRQRNKPSSAICYRVVRVLIGPAVYP